MNAGERAGDDGTPPRRPGDAETGDRSPEILVEPPGPVARSLAADLARLEPPGVNTVPAEATVVGPILWREAVGSNVVDVDGNRYLDFTSGFGVAGVGHRHPRVVAAVRDQAGVLLHALGDVQAHPARIELARRLAALAPVDGAQVFFAVSGSDAVEIALKSALLATGRPGIVAFEPSYHGLSLGALAATSRPAFREPFSAQLNPHVVRLPFAGDLAGLRTALRTASVGAVLFEPIVGREGVLVPPPGWLAGVAASAREAGALVVADEVFTGFGRTGATFVVDDEGVRPDLLCCGKALAGGLPIAATVGRREVLAAWKTSGEALHTGTFLANPLACRAALACLELIEAGALARRSRELGGRLGERLEGWRGVGGVRAVRGRGLLWGIEVASPEIAGRWVRRAQRRGVLVLAGGPHGTVVEVVPPLTIPRRLLDEGVDLLGEALREAAGAVQ